MNRVEFMNQLKNLLWDIPEHEREEALNYYEDYFDDAGAENEAQVIKSLGNPEKVAAIIKDGLKEDAAEQGEFSENGFTSYDNTMKNEVGYRSTPVKSKLCDRFKNLGTGGWILILILAIFALPILGPVLIGIAGTLFGVLMAAAVILLLAAIVGIVLLVAGASVFAASIGALFANPAVGIMLLGLSLLLIGIGILITILGIKIVTVVIPPVIRWFVRLVQKPFAKKEV